MSSRSRTIGVFGVILAGLFFVVGMEGAKTYTSPPPVKLEKGRTWKLPPLLTPQTTRAVPAVAAVQSVDLRFLVLSADGTEPSFAALKAFLDQVGIPFTPWIVNDHSGGLPPLTDEATGKGLYQAIILATGNLATCTPQPCHIALPAEGWAALDQYALTYSVRTVSYYTFPEPRYGIAFTGQATTSGSVTFAGPASSVFSYLNRANAVPLTDAWTYLATPAPAAGETTQRMLLMSGQTVGVIHKKADGREYLALTMDNNPFLLHSLAFNYGVFNWAAKGLFLGSRRYYLSPQVDDIFLANDMFDSSIPACKAQRFSSGPHARPDVGVPHGTDRWRRPHAHSQLAEQQKQQWGRQH